MPRNIKGQIVSEGYVTVKLSKTLQAIAKEVSLRARPIVRDELERTHRANVYDSYTPAINGSYNHTGLLVSSIRALIDGDTVKIEVTPRVYPNSFRTPNAAYLTTEVYDILKYGSKPVAKSETYVYEGDLGNPEYSDYIQQKPHNFEARTREQMRVYLNNLAINIQKYPQNYSKKYTDAVRKKFLNRM